MEAINESREPGASARTNPSRHAKDVAFAARLRAGEAGAYEQLLERYQGPLYRHLMRIVRNEADAEEVLQTTFLQVFRRIELYDGNAALGTWLYRVATNSALMWLRSQKRHTKGADYDALEMLNNEDAALAPLGVVPQADQTQEAREQLDRVERALERLPEEHRTVFVLRDVEGLSNVEAAERLGLSIAAIKSRLHRARLALREALEDA
ncbi:MAG: sigma-70 family RNA polymerase sigma factor [Chrysiogenetes bacterium]|nr:sigma-70 family RNA polymerase sigma factor [Chrysiogenetes bacterium]